MLDKGVPSTFANLKHLYTDSFKKDTLGAIAKEYLKTKHGESGDKVVVNGDSLKGEAAAYYYLAQHYNYHLSRDLTKATEFVEKGLESAPGNLEFQMTKARIYKHEGDLQKAAEAMDEARNIDLKDRNINSKSAKYFLRNNDNAKALSLVGLFTRNDSPEGPLGDLLDMQCMWFLTEDGEAYARQGKTGLALKRFHQIYNIFDVWQEDQFDFHAFSLRKGQVRAYVDMIRWEDHLRDHPFFTRAALQAVQVYLKLHDGKSINGMNGNAETEEDAAERKKKAKKAKKEAQKAEREAAERAAKQDPNKAKPQGEETQKRDEDPNGFKLAAVEKPLDEAVKFLTPLLQFSPKHIDAQILGFEVYLRRGEYPSL